jgi:hypothetical protein
MRYAFVQRGATPRAKSSALPSEAPHQRFRDTKEFAPTIEAAAEQFDISATAVEKDYWVSEVLRVLASEFPGDFILKGGTSLSKGYDLIQRFSEDIDILVIPGTRGRGATDKLMKRMSETAAAWIAGTAASYGGAETGRHRSYEIHYPALRPATQLIQTRVLLEMGVRGGGQPQETVTIGSLLGDALARAGTDLTQFPDLEPFHLAVLHPGRTLLEKLVLVHIEAQRLSLDPDRAPDQRIGRHFYDIHELLGDRNVQELIHDQTQVEEILKEIGDITRLYFINPEEELETSPPGGFMTSPGFQPGSEVSERLRSAYEETMPRFYFGADPLPDWDAISDRVARAKDHI